MDAADAVLGLIPAHAGKTWRHLRSLTARWAHPRSRGENQLGQFASVLICGSSPLTRGKPRAGDGFEGSVRLIPAHAGKTPEVNVSHFTYPAHPRSRGENGSWIEDSFGCSGSSPLTRGKRGRRRKGSHLRGLIPAHAGKTFSCAPNRVPSSAHPRSRGENALPDRHDHARPGSSPLTRGKLMGCIALVFRSGLIPAHAGKTSAAK